ncbi:MAG: replication protein [Oscillospiraceae bacterium]|nr:replication protein [Oscillospiraceae bacterium]
MASARRFRNFATVVYPDSENTPDSWLSILQDFKTPILVSPFHDQDLNPTGEPKKPHYHVLIMFEGMKSPDQVKELFDQVGGVGLETVNSLRGYARYLCHLDNPDKHQYFPGDVQQMSGVDYLEIIGLPSDRYELIGEMIDYCQVEYIYSYATLLVYARHNRQDWFRILCDSGTIVIKEFLKSLRWEHEQYMKENGRPNG